jgi:DUF1680 family protein
VKSPDSDGDYPYYSTYSPVATKVYYPKKWPCCSGTLVQTVADYPLDIYMQSRQGIEVNLYTPSQVTWKQGSTSVTLVQKTSYPAEDIVSIAVHPNTPVNFTLNLRIPSWMPASAQITLNGKLIATGTRGTYFSLHRHWKQGDVVELHIPQDFRTEAIDDLHPTTVALMRGPVQYVALNPTKQLSQDRLTLPAGLKQLAPQAFIENYAGQQIIFIPLHQVQNETYTSYFSRA